MIFDPKMSVYNLCDRWAYHPLADNIHFSRSVLASSSAWLPLLYDTVVLVLIAHKTLPDLRLKNRYSIMKRLLEDGLIYYTYATSIVDPRHSDSHVWIKGYFCGQCGFNNYGHRCAPGFEKYHGAVSDCFLYCLI
jgi:hypothetical protein